ncbi:TlpA family protein disulfide reductase [Belliella pelovolcani]|uniref:TlpA family protein disulfide reductase n=1 Tax=Belliella pelovolcani TaxID=529505 RepID=UPI0039195131
MDFWATWCAPCVANMPHLETLQEKYQDQLLIVPVSFEEEDRINKFISNKPYKLQFSIDNENKLRSLFPFRIIPHAVLIDPFGKIVAITDPKNITEEIIAKLLNGEEILLPIKQDRVDFNLMKDDLFELPANTKQSFKVLGEFEGLPSFQKSEMVGEYKGRRITFINQSIRGIFQDVFDKGWRRFQINEHDTKRLEEEMYSIDLVIENPNEVELKTTLLTKMEQQFDLQIDTVKVESETILLYVEDENKLPKRSEQNYPYSASGDHFTSKGATIADFASYLEGFGIIGGIVVCDDCQEKSFEIDFHFEPENPDSFWDNLKNLGLNLKKETREVEMIRIRELD